MSFLSASKSAELGEQGNPLTTTADISNNEFNGFQTLFVDFGGELNNPIEVDMLFGESGGPYYTFSFAFLDTNFSVITGSSTTGSPGISQLNNTTCVVSYTSSNTFQKSSGNLNLTVDGSQNPDNMWDNNYSIDGNDGGVGSGSYNDLYLYNAKYYNHATNSLLSQSEESALRAHINELSDLTPHTSVESDSDGSSPPNFNLNGGLGPTGRDPPHRSVLRTGSNSVNLNPAVSVNSDRYSGFSFTHNSREFDTSGSATGNTLSSGTGLSNISSDLIVPDEMAIYSGTGGGTVFGTPYVTGLSTVSDNKRNGRTFFLVRD